MTRPSPAALKYLAQRATEAERQVKIAIGMRLGATVVKRRTRTWQLRRAEYEAAVRQSMGRDAA